MKDLQISHFTFCGVQTRVQRPKFGGCFAHLEQSEIVETKASYVYYFYCYECYLCIFLQLERISAHDYSLEVVTFKSLLSAHVYYACVLGRCYRCNGLVGVVSVPAPIFFSLCSQFPFHCAKLVDPCLINLLLIVVGWHLRPAPSWGLVFGHQRGACVSAVGMASEGHQWYVMDRTFYTMECEWMPHSLR